MRRLLVLGGIVSLSCTVAAIALLVGREERPASAGGFCPPDFYFTRQVQVWYGTLSGPGVDPNALAVELTDEITENLRQQIIADSSVDQRVKDDNLGSWVVATDDATWASGPEEDFPAENNLRNDLTLGAPPNGTVAFGSADAEYYRNYRLGFAYSGSCISPPFQSFYYYDASVIFYELNATFTPNTPSPSASAPPTPTAPPTATSTPTAPASTSTPTAPAPPTPPPTLAPTPTCQTTDDCAVGGDANCDSAVDLEDMEAVLADVGGIQPAPCPISANVRCHDGLDGRDALLILKNEAGLTATVPGGCKPIG